MEIEVKFKHGQEVQHKLGGPEMTIHAFAYNHGNWEGYFICKWYEQNDFKEVKLHQEELDLMSKS